MKILLRILVWLLGVVLGVPLLAFCLALGALQLDAVRDRLLEVGAEALRAQGIDAELVGLQGTIPLSLGLSRLRLGDSEGPWLELTDFRFSWRPSELLRGRVWVEELAVGSLRLERLPPPEPEPVPVPEPTDQADQEPFELPPALPGIVLERLAISSLQLGSSLIGEPIELTLEGRGQAPPGDEIGLDLSLRRVDQNTAELGLSLGLDPARERLRLDLGLDESGGLFERLAGLPLSGPVRLRLRGEGDLGDWPAELALSLPGVVELNSNLELALRKPLGLDLVADLRFAEKLVGADVLKLLGDKVSVALALNLATAQRVDLTALKIGTNAASVEGRGEIDLETRQIRVDMDASVRDLAVAESLAGQPLAGTGTLALAARGPMLQPKVDLRVGLEELRAGDIRIAALETRADLALDRPLGNGLPQGKLRLDGELSGLRAPGDLPFDGAAWTAVAGIDEKGKLTLSSLVLDAGAARVEVSGRLDVDSMAGHLELQAGIEDLQPISAAGGIPLAGSLQLDGTADFDSGFQEIDTEARVGFSGLKGLPAQAQVLLGAEPRLRAAARVTSQAVRVSALELKGPEVDLSGVGELRPTEDRLDFRASLAIPRLASLRSADVPVSGNLSAALNLSGKISDPAATLLLTIDKLAAAERNLESLRAELAADSLLSAPAGRFRLETGPVAQRLTLVSEFSQKGRNLSIPSLQLTAPGTRLAGKMEVSLGDGRVNGELRGGVEDLAKLEFWLQDPTLGGAVDLDLALDSRERQALELKAAARELKGGFGSLKRADLATRLDDLYEVAGLQARLEVETLQVGDWSVPELDVRVEGGLDRLAATADFAVAGAEDGRLRTRMGVSRRAAKHLVHVDSLEGSWAEQPIRSNRPATIEIGERSLRLSDLDLSLGSGRLSADGRYGAGGAEARVVLERVPLDLARAFLPKVGGELNGALSLSGSLARPVAKVELDLDKLKVEDEELEKVPEVRIRGTATVAGRRVQGDLSIERLTDQPLRAEFEIPFRFALEPFVAEVPPDAPLRVGFVGDADLARLIGFVELDDQRLAGRLHASLRVEGSAADPQVKGQVEVSNGHYENGFTGTLIEDLTLRAEATGRGVRIKRLTATDGANGRLGGTAEASWDREGALTYTAALQLDDATLMRHSDMQATLGGRVSARGTPEGGRVTGEVTVIRAELRIPERIPPSIPTVEVEELDGKGESPAEAPKAADAESPVALDLRILIPSRFFVRGRGLESEWKGKLDVKGTATSPQVLGNLEVARGRFDFLDERFTLQEGKIEFFGNHPPQPNLKFRATAPGRDIVGVLNVSGPPDNLKLTLGSEPSLPQDEVLARLLFDQELKEVSGLEALKIALAVRELAGKGGGGPGLMDRARSSLGLDTLDVGAGGAGGATVKAGKYLEDDVYLEVESGLGDAGSRVRVEKDLLPNLSVEASVDQHSNSGFGINWKKDY